MKIKYFVMKELYSFTNLISLGINFLSNKLEKGRRYAKRLQE